MFLSRGDRDLGVAFQTHPGRQAFLSAGALKYQHKNVIALIRKYIKELQTFNPITFKKLLGTKLPQGGYTKPTEYAVLDEKQATLLICFMQNNVIAM